MELWTFDIPAQSPRDFPPLSTNHRSSSANGTLELSGVTFFIIQGLTNLDEKKIILFSILLLIYIMILGGNSIIIYVALTDPKLNSPLYFFLCNLSFVDMVYTTTTIPNMLSGLLTDILTISVLGCFLQMYFFIQLSVTGRAILTVMAYDRYVAICTPLQYNSIMTRPVRLLLVAGAWGFGAVCTLPATVIAFERPYCGPNVVKHAWYPHTLLLHLDWCFHIQDGCCSEAEGVQNMCCPPDCGVHLLCGSLICIHFLPSGKLFTRGADHCVCAVLCSDSIPEPDDL
ncbi:olfactory receptor 49 isoform X2 [Oreochromis niloticus]|uniref:olfactory receptor 49 isoform X2 n=1 Tax=Oreochromis niloticus TaxID=8128 RepID=UPI000393DD51|nr:olfactory receptor 49 isoform X2 [Oreochromis niloticus]